MRRVGMVILVVLVALVVAAPSFAKVCHPKKPLTCTAAHLTQAPAVDAFAAPVKKVRSTATRHQQLKTQHAMACGPWVKWMCTGTPGLI